MKRGWEETTMGKAIRIGLITVAVASLARAAAAQSVTPCPNAANCAQVSLAAGSAAAGAMVSTGINFKQGPNDSKPGEGIDEIAALALTVNLTANLTLNDCTLDANGLPASVRLVGGLNNFNLMVENAACANGKTHCLCPTDGTTTPDPFINIVVFGPNPLPSQGTGVDIPVLPDGRIIDLDLKIGAGAPTTTQLHIYTESVDSTKPQFTAFLSTGDKGGTDVTCVRVQGQPPCSAGSTSQVAISDATITKTGLACVGDCGGNGEVTVDELILMVNVALGGTPVSSCLAGDRDSNGEITIDEILQAVNNSLVGCPTS
jgi:hypothetical protein